MATSKEYLTFALDHLKQVKDVSHRPMMGEYVLYYKEKVIGGIYENRILLKQTEASKKLLAPYQLVVPYQGAKEMILLENIEDSTFLFSLFEEMYEQLPAKKKK